MSNVQDRPPGAKYPPAEQVDLNDPAARAGWLADLREQIADICAAGLDATAPPAARDLGRRTARRIITDAERALTSLLAHVSVADAPPVAGPSPRKPPLVPPASNEADEIRSLCEGWIDLVVGARNADERRLHLYDASLPTLLLYALGEPRENVEGEPVVVAVLDAIRSTLDGWAGEMSERRTIRVSHNDVRVLVRRVDVAIEIVRRSRGGAS